MDSKFSENFIEIFLKSVVVDNSDNKKDYLFATNKYDFARNKLYSLDKLPLILGSTGFLGLKIHLLKDDGKLYELGKFSILELAEMSKGQRSILDVLIQKHRNSVSTTNQ